MARVLFQCSGSEANDTAIKLAWYYWNAVGQPQRTKIIARQMAYHGNTCAAVSLSGKPDMHAGFGLPFAIFKHTEFPHYYRRHEPGESELEFSTRMAKALEALIEAEGPETIAAFFAEPVMGAGGAILPPQGYFEKVQEVLRKHDILFVADEVICGFARTGEMWGCQTFGILPDMLTSAKALSAAMLPISAVLINDRVHEATLRAPADSIVSVIVAEVGENVSAGQPVLAIAATDKQWLSFNAREDMLHGLTVGDKVEVMRAGGEPTPAMVTELTPLGPFATWQAERAIGDHDRNTLRLRLDPQGAQTGFEPGMTVWLER
jgi:adenosylmethionine-8-amino-7-oxononanoate aminotransferase